MALPDWNCQNPGHYRRRNVNRCVESAVGGGDLNYVDACVQITSVVILFESEARGRLRINLHPTIPDNLRNWLRYFLQPRFVSSASVVKKKMRESCESESSLRRFHELDFL